MTRSIVLIHAVRSSRTMWKGQVRRLRDRGYEVIAPDLPGHGARRGEPFTLKSALATIDEAVSRASDRRCSSASRSAAISPSTSPARTPAGSRASSPRTARSCPDPRWRGCTGCG
ncbi:alpha/beta hydrolase [Brachybacterium sp. GPGPB12]|uniref:alpha/beta hydrolase n=1 Tax=Brachybacterium sp. GPGPB12 TaxID=3023517 RepID=UPI0031345C04